MIVGILKEIKSNENRVAMTPAGVETLRQHDHTVLVEAAAGRASGFSDNDYHQAGSEIVATPQEIYQRSEMVMHVKEPLPPEYDLIREGQIVFTYFHFACSEVLTRTILDRRCIAIAYETIQSADGSLPLLKPMSEVAGRMAVQQAAKYLEMPLGGNGVLLGGVPGVEPANVVILGGGIVGTNAAKMACGLGAKVYLLDNNLERLRYLSDVMPPNCFLVMANPANIRNLVKDAHVVIGAVLVAGAKAPLLVSADMLKTMRDGAVLVDVAIDQGGCFETSRPTTHTDPTYVIDGVLHYCVANMPGAVARTSTLALTNATLPYALQIANKGWRAAVEESAEIRSGVNIVEGKVSCRGVAEAFGLECFSVD